jgi:four helix bundle protein
MSSSFYDMVANKRNQRNWTNQKNKIMKISRFEDLQCWKEARTIVRQVYRVTSTAEFKKDYGLSGQVQRAAISVMANIAEGFVRRSNKEFIQFLFVAMSSAAEVQNHLYVASDLHYISDVQFNETYSQADKTARIISGLITYLKQNQLSYKSATRETKETKKTRETRWAK